MFAQKWQHITTIRKGKRTFHIFSDTHSFTNWDFTDDWDPQPRKRTMDVSYLAMEQLGEFRNKNAKVNSSDKSHLKLIERACKFIEKDILKSDFFDESKSKILCDNCKHSALRVKRWRDFIYCNKLKQKTTQFLVLNCTEYSKAD